MSRIGGKDTALERTVRSMLHRMGYRFRIHHKRRLPGKPDVILPKHRIVVFAHGCFWHRHKGCKFSYTPKTRMKFWREKFEGNVERDRRVQRELRKLGWKVVVVWECETAGEEKLRKLLKKRLGK